MMAVMETVKCTICSKPFDTERADLAQYCSTSCSQKRWANCTKCGQTFVQHRRLLREGKTICGPCGGKGAEGAIRKEKPCTRCGKVFLPNGNRQSYCSDACRRGTAVCLECGTEFNIAKKAKGLFCSKRCFYDFKSPVGSIIAMPSGYVIEKVPEGYPVRNNMTSSGRWMLQHRYVMEQRLGRFLEPHEEVHHLNGDRSCNEDSNLELWKKSQPAGVRAADYHCPGCRCHEMND